MDSQESMEVGSDDQSPVHLRKIFVGNLDFATTEDDLRDYLCGYGEIADIVIMFDKWRNNSKGWGFCTFMDPMSVDSVMKARPHILENRTLEIKRAVRKDLPAGSKGDIKTKSLHVSGIELDMSILVLRELFSQFGKVLNINILIDQEAAIVEFDDWDAVDKACLQENIFVNDVQVHVKKHVAHSSGGRIKDGGVVSSSQESVHDRKLCVFNVSFATTEQQLKDYFGKYGEIESLALMYDNNTKRSKGWGFITFKESATIDTILADHPHRIDDRNIETKRALRKDNSEPMANKLQASGVSVDMSEDVQLRKIFVAKLSFDTTEDDLKEHFEEYGELEDVRINRDQKTGKSKGFGFITFTDVSGVDAAQAARPHKITRREVMTVRSIRKDQQGSADAKLQVKKLFVRGIKYDMNKDDLEEVFSQFGKVLSAHIPIDKATGNSRNYGFIEYDDPDCVDKACLWPLITVKGREVTVRKAPDQDPPSNKESGRSSGGRDMYDHNSYVDRFGSSQGGYGDGRYGPSSYGSGFGGNSGGFGSNSGGFCNSSGNFGRDLGGYGSGTSGYGNCSGGYGSNFSGYDGRRDLDRMGSSDRYGRDMGPGSNFGAMRSSGFSNRSTPYNMGGSERNNRF